MQPSPSDTPAEPTQSQRPHVIWATETNRVMTAPSRRRTRFPNRFALIILAVGYVLFAASLFLPVLTTGDAWGMTHSTASAWGMDLFFSGHAQSLVFWAVNAPLLASGVFYVLLLRHMIKAGHFLFLTLMTLHWIGFASGVLLIPIALFLGILAQMTARIGVGVIVWIVSMLCVGVGLSLLSMQPRMRER